MSRTTLPTPDAQVADYLERLRDVLPPREASTVLAEVSALIDDRLDAEARSGGATPEGAERALMALGSPESLATSLVGGGTTIDLATRRAFGRMLAVLFAGHLLVSIILTVVGRESKLIPGFVTALPQDGWFATAAGLGSIFFLDAGILGVVFALFGRRRSPAILQRLRLRMPVRRRDAVSSLVLLTLVAVLANVATFRDALFSIGAAESRTTILAPELLDLLPAANGVIALFALRFLLQVISGTERVESVAVDGVASLAGAAFCVLVMTRNQLVRFPTSAGLPEASANLFSDLILRVVLVVGFVASLLLVTRFVKRCLRLRQLVAR